MKLAKPYQDASCTGEKSIFYKCFSSGSLAFFKGNDVFFIDFFSWGEKQRLFLPVLSTTGRVPGKLANATRNDHVRTLRYALHC